MDEEERQKQRERDFVAVFKFFATGFMWWIIFMLIGIFTHNPCAY